MKNIAQTVGFLDYRPAAVVRVTGEDALSFLQGQFTQELRPGRSSSVAYGLWLNQKGRVLADSHALRVSESEVWLFSESSPASLVVERLEAYIIADDVVLTDLTSAWHGRVWVGPAAGAALGQAVGGTPPEPGRFIRVGEGFVFRGRRGVDDAWEWIGPELPPLPPGVPALTEDALVSLRIEAGVPRIPQELGPGELPNEGGLDDSAISYTKGCYLGQEVMARLKAMGRVRRRLLRVETEDSVGSALPAPLYQGGRVRGELRACATADNRRTVGLALCTLLELKVDEPLTTAAEGGDTAWQLRDRP